MVSTASEPMIVHPDAWLSEQLGRPAFAVAPAAASPQEVRAAMASHEAPADAFYTAKVGILDLAMVEALAAEGFVIVETSLTFGRPIERHPIDPQVSICRPEWRDAVLDIAEHAFRFTRFHVDPRVARQAANRVKRAWMQSYVDGRRGDTLLVAHHHGAVLGFNALMVGDRPDGRAAVIDLIAVHPDHQKRGVGRMMVEGALHHYQDTCRSMEVGTQASNVPSVRLYERLGFRLMKSGFVLHRHGRP